MKEIVVDIFDTASIDNAIAEIEAYKKRVERLEGYLRKLTELGAKVAEEAFRSAALYGGKDIVTVDIEPIKDGYAIKARGSQVAFIEFGAGVYYNGAEPYLGERPEGIVGIGEYGYGLGALPEWSYTDDNGERVHTHGTPASQGMYFAQKAMAEEAQRIFNEVFNGD